MKLIPDRVKAILLTVIVFIYAAPYIPIIQDNLLITGFALLACIATWSAIQRAWFDVLLALAIAASFGIGRLIFAESTEAVYLYRSSAVLAFIGLHLVLLIGPWSHWSRAVRRLYMHRRHLGVATFLLSWFHVATILREYFLFDIQLTFITSFTIFGYTAFNIMIWLALTSWDTAQKKITLKWWGVLHTLALIQFIVYAAMGWMNAVDITTTQKVVLILFTVVWILMAPYTLPRLLFRRVNGWKQLHVLVYIAYVSVILHSWLAYVQYMNNWLPTAYWAIVIVTVGSHLWGRVQQLIEWRKHAAHSAEAIEENGHTYQHVEVKEEIESGKAIRVVVKNIPLALFRNGDTYFAISALCPHQGGPLDKGKIVNGYVECPWHKWQFSTEDGQGPPEFPDCVPYYKVLQRKGELYVAVEPSGACKLQNGHYKKVA